MDVYDLTTNQLKRAASIKEEIGKLNRELRGIFGDSSPSATLNKKRTMSATAKRKIAASQTARWAKLRRAKAMASQSSRPAESERGHPSEINSEAKSILGGEESEKKVITELNVVSALLYPNLHLSFVIP